MKNRPDDERVVTERQLVEAVEEDEAVRQDGQPVGVQVEDFQLLQLADAIWGTFNKELVGLNN
jgi:hypothetical protein